MSAITGKRAAQLRYVYFAIAARDGLRGHSPVVIDKTPLNLLHLGFGRAIFPSCRFVLISRHPLDVSISNFAAAFGEGFVAANPFLKSLEHIGHFSKWPWESSLDYQHKIGDKLRLQSYHSLVEDIETEARRLVAHAGLEWNQACLQPEIRHGKVATASVLQVRSPIHKGRLDRWKACGDAINPLVDGFGRWGRVAEWEDRDRLSQRVHK